LTKGFFPLACRHYDVATIEELLSENKKMHEIFSLFFFPLFFPDTEREKEEK